MDEKCILFWYFFVVYCLKLSCTHFQCATTSNNVCSFNDQCKCSTSASDSSDLVYCKSDNGDFPKFTDFSLPITSLNIIGAFSSITDNSFYALANMTRATVCIQTLGMKHDLLVYDDSFKTMNKDGIETLLFNGYYPADISTLSNSAYIRNLCINNAGVMSLPNFDSFTSLVYANFDYNSISAIDGYAFHVDSLTQVSLQQSNIISIKQYAFNGPSIDTVILTGNKIYILETNVFSGGSISNVDISNNLLSKLESSSFNLESLTYINASYNRISNIDYGFFEWFSKSKANTISLQGFTPFQCNSSMQWMANFIICDYPNSQIQVSDGTHCQSGGYVFDYLTPFADCSSLSSAKAVGYSQYCFFTSWIFCYFLLQFDS